MRVPISGREHELAAITLALTGPLPAAVVLEGEAGIGKSILFRRALEGVDGRLVLASRPLESDGSSSYAVLRDLLDPVWNEVASASTPARRTALAIALRRIVPTSGGATAEDVGLAVLDALRHLAASRSLIVAIDDVQWADGPSAAALRFALRRLEDEAIGFFFAARTTDPADAVTPLDGAASTRLRLGPLDQAEIRRIVVERVGLALPHEVLVKLHDRSGGNPFFALEIARALDRRGADIVRNDDLPIPSSLRALVAERLAMLSAESRRVCLYAALLARPSISLLELIDDEKAPVAALDEAVAAGVAEVARRNDILFTHPLLRSVLEADALPLERRGVHARLAGVVTDPEERGRHIAMSVTVPSREIGSTLQEAAAHAFARGAPSSAAVLLEDSRRLTPATEREAAYRRGLEAIDRHFEAGDMSAATRLASEMLESAVGPDERASLLYRSATITWRDRGWAHAETLLEAAAAAGSEDADQLARIEEELGFIRMHRGDLPGAAAHARRCIAFAERTDDAELRAGATVRLASYDFIMGNGADLELIRSASSAPRTRRRGIAAVFDPSTVLAYVLKTSDRFDEARPLLEAENRRAAREGNESAIPFILSFLSELEFWAGRWEAAEHAAVEGLRMAELTEQPLLVPVMRYCLAMVAAGRGDLLPAREQGEAARAASEETGNVPVTLMAQSALAFIDLTVGDLAGAHERLGAVALSLAAMGAGEPGCVRFLADEIEALVGLGDIPAATAVTDYLEERGRTLDRPWALATGARSRGLVQAAGGDIGAAMASLERAVHEHERLAMPLELGRTLMVQGEILRRGKRKAAAKECLDAATAIFDGLGARPWARKARNELARVGVGPRPSGEFTPTEQRIADLVTSGRTNHEVADELFISVKTVESNLSRIYRKARVRSRTELAGALAAKSIDAGTPPPGEVTSRRDAHA